MKSLNAKKGAFGLNLVGAFIFGILFLVILGYTSIILLNSLDSTSLATNTTKAFTSNASTGLANLFSNIPTWFSLLVIVVIILIITVVIFAVKRFKGDQGGESM
jgi:hypothetical protein